MKVVCIGDSLTYGYGVNRKESWIYLVENKYDVEIFNKGMNGDTTEGMILRFQRDVIENKSSYVMIMGGSNDLIMGIPLQIIQSNIDKMVNLAYENNINPIIGIQPFTEPKMANMYWSSTTDFNRVNENIEKYKEWAIQFEKTDHIRVIDFCSELNIHVTEENKHLFYIDGVHLTSKGHKIMANIEKLKAIFEN
ncbi:GDSL-type esterase/lipase family protein [Crassaminicella profunda]|uniref:GDSL-type esterase/lipase family protein n=1 Tax=Crassaminicella profunda TaxID=1286698 RepID=UPI001CA73057|nr:GDSL-type esterase/lipase family protein [Crassaminicella profunda]QZY56731.1 hypothetical protein K7H06_07360 [Crassaminicella profunda]